MFFIFDYLSNLSKPSDCCRKISVHKMASVNELKNELSSAVNSTVSNLKRNRTEAMLDKELLKTDVEVTNGPHILVRRKSVAVFMCIMMLETRLEQPK